VARTRQSEILEEIEDDVAFLDEADEAAEILLLRITHPDDVREIRIIRQALARIQHRADIRRARTSPKRSRRRVAHLPPTQLTAPKSLLPSLRHTIVTHHNARVE
jgi:hypothetical protein